MSKKYNRNFAKHLLLVYAFVYIVVHFNALDIKLIYQLIFSCKINYTLLFVISSIK